MTIHGDDPFRDPTEDSLKRLRGRLGGAVTLWTSTGARGPVGLTVSSVVVAAGEPGHVLGLVDPDSDLGEALRPGSRLVVQLLHWRHRDLAEAFAGRFPAPGGPFAATELVDSAYGPRLATSTTWAGAEVVEVREVGWSLLVDAALLEVEVGADAEPLEHRRGRYHRAAGADDG